MHEVMLKSLPVSNPGGLYRLGDKVDCCVEGQQDDWTMFSYPQYEYFVANTQEWEQLSAAQTNRPDLSVRRPGADAAESFSGELVSGNYFCVLGLQAHAGRLISPQDDREGAPQVAVMSYRAWQEKYGNDASLIGRSVTINGMPLTLMWNYTAGFLWRPS
jgi:putative ABC transport system permease protein